MFLAGRVTSYLTFQSIRKTDWSNYWKYRGCKMDCLSSNICLWFWNACSKSEATLKLTMVTLDLIFFFAWSFSTSSKNTMDWPSSIENYFSAKIYLNFSISTRQLTGAKLRSMLAEASVGQEVRFRLPNLLTLGSWVLRTRTMTLAEEHSR